MERPCKNLNGNGTYRDNQGIFGVGAEFHKPQAFGI